MKRNLLHCMLSAAMIMFAGQAMAQGVQETLGVTSDVTLASTSADKAKATEKAIEMYTSRTDGAITKEFLGLMSFKVPVKSGYTVKSANLKLVTERAKGTLAIYALDAEVSDADTYNSQISNVNAARGKEPIAKVKLKGTSNKAVTDAGASANIEDWTNNIDITDYVKSAGGNVNLVLLNAAESTTTSIKVYSSDAEDVTNTKVTPNFTFAAADLHPQLTVVYEVDAAQKTDVSLPTADTYVRKNNTTKFGSKTTMELKSKDDTDFIGMMSFQIPAEAIGADYEITSATLRLVTERTKGSRNFNLYKYVAFDENTTYADEETNLAAARTEDNLIGTYSAKGLGNKSNASDELTEEFKTVDAWTNEIDLTSYVKTLDTNTVAVLIEHTNSADQLMFYTKEAEDVTNKKDASVVFKKEDLVPQLTVVYTKKSGTGVKTIETNVPVAVDNNVYNLQGVRMNGDNLPAGIYIKNGKKFVVK